MDHVFGEILYNSLMNIGFVQLAYLSIGSDTMGPAHHDCFFSGQVDMVAGISG